MLSVSGKMSKDYSEAVEILRKYVGETEREIEKELEDHFKTIEGSEEVKKRSVDHFRRCLEYTVRDGKMTRGATVVLTLLKLQKETSEEEERVAGILGCALEILQAAFLVLDDIMDKSTMRRGKVCWHLVEEVGVANAVNDGLFLENAVFGLVRRCVPKDRKLAVYELINKTVLRTVVGQNLDVNSEAVKDFTEERYKAIVKSKTAFYSFWLPVALGCVLVDPRMEEEEEDYEKGREICMLLGEYFQVQDDVLDCYAETEVLGKKGTDIEEGKCTWLAVETMKRGNEEEKKEMKEIFRKEERTENDVKKIKNLYTSLKLPEIFEEFEFEQSCIINKKLDSMKNENLKQVLALLFARIHKRHK
jgi:farnesyl diphosphate synthase